MIDPNALFDAAEAVAVERGFDAAITELQSKLRDTHNRKEQERNAILHVIGRLRKRKGECGFYRPSGGGAKSSVPPADDRKPDPDTPFRYVCPDCEGPVRRRRESTTYQCDECRGSWHEDELHDKKPAERPIA